MADEASNATAEGTTTTNGVDVRRTMTREQQDAADRSAFLSGTWEADAEPEPAKPAAKKPAAKPVEDDDEDEDRDEAADEDEDSDEEAEEVSEDDEDSDEDKDLDDEEDEDDDKPADPDVSKRLDSVRRAEKRLRERHDEREKRFAAERDSFVAEWKPKIAEAEEFSKLKAKTTPYNAAEILMKLGLSQDELEEAARDVFAHSKKGSEDPKNKEAIAKSRGMRELSDRLAATEKKLSEREEADKKRAEEHAANEAGQKLIKRTAKALSDDQPALQRIKNPARLHQRIAEATMQLWDKFGEQPSTKRILKRAERLYRAELEDAGVDIAAPTKTDAKTEKTATAKPAAKKPAIEVVDQTKAAPKNGRAVLPSREDMIAGLDKINRGLDPDAE